jgi:hypothetical protein
VADVSAMQSNAILVAQYRACRSAVAAAYLSAAAATTEAGARLAERLRWRRLAQRWRLDAAALASDARSYAQIAGSDVCPGRVLAALCGGVAGAMLGLGLALVIEWCWRLCASVVLAAMGRDPYRRG